MTLLNLNREDAFHPIRERFDKLFDQMFGPDSLHAVRSNSRSGYPKLDIVETHDQYRIEVAVPGVNPDDLKVEVVPVVETQGNFGIDTQYRVLRISGKMDYQFQTPEDAKFQYRELRRGQFTREVLLPEWMAEDPVATHEHGILKLEWSKPEKAKIPEPKQIPIRKGNGRSDKA